LLLFKLLFQLLFLGRHPFAGRPLVAEEIDEEAAIRRHLFAYSQHQQPRLLAPPPSTFPMQALSDGLQTHFHQAFEQENNRPTAANWLEALHLFALQLVHCQAVKGHVYPNTLESCLWCHLANTTGIHFFREGESSEMRQLTESIALFAGRYALPAWHVPKEPGPLVLPTRLKPALPSLWAVCKTYLLIYALLAFLALMGQGFAAGNYQLAGSSAFFVLVVGIFLESHRRAEMKRRRTALDVSGKMLQAKRAAYHHRLQTSPQANTYFALEESLQAYQALPRELKLQLGKLEEERYRAALNAHFATIALKGCRIPGIGKVRLAEMERLGICTLADLPRLHRMHVPGIGPKNRAALLAFQQQQAIEFAYVATGPLEGRADVLNAMGTKKQQLEHQIQAAHTALANQENTLPQLLAPLLAQVQQAALEEMQAKTDAENFRWWLLFGFR